MTINVTRWSPDTCDCVIDYEWDSALDENIRTHTYRSHIVICNDHRHLLGILAHATVVHENVIKNVVHHLATAHLGEGNTIQPIEHNFDRVANTLELVFDAQEFPLVPVITSKDVLDMATLGLKSHNVTLNRKLVPAYRISVR